MKNQKEALEHASVRQYCKAVLRKRHRFQRRRFESWPKADTSSATSR